MTNKEKYAKELLDVLCETGEIPAVVKGKIVACDGAVCQECKFKDLRHGCGEIFKAWAQEEYKAPEVDWAKVPKDTKILVKDKKENLWINSHFAYYKDGKPFAFLFGRSSWTVTPGMRTYPWKYTEIADPEERKKYLKYE